MRSTSYTWYNGMFILNRAFKLIKKIIYDKKISRYSYENIFHSSSKKSNNIRIKGVLNDSINGMNVLMQTHYFSKYFKFSEEKEKAFVYLYLILEITFLIIFLKVKLLKFSHTKK